MKPLARTMPLLISLLLVVACSAPTPPSAPQPKAASATSPGVSPDRLGQLYDLAKKEGTLVWNLATNDRTYDPAVAAFGRRFPEVQIETINVNSPAVPARIITEHDAGKVTIDVSQGSIGSLMPLIERNFLKGIEWTGLNASMERVLLDGRAVKTHDSPWVFFYNAKLVPEAEVPRSWEDLLNAGWKSKMTFSGGMSHLAALPLAWGEQRATEYVERLGKQEVARAARVAASLDSVSRGEHLIGVGSLALVLQAIKDGAPLEIAPFGPQIALLTVATSFDLAPHPNSAALLLAWLATDEAEQALAAGGYLSFTRKPILDQSLGQLIADKRIELQFEDTIDKSRSNGRLLPNFIKTLGFAP